MLESRYLNTYPRGHKSHEMGFLKTKYSLHYLLLIACWWIVFIFRCGFYDLNIIAWCSRRNLFSRWKYNRRLKIFLVERKCIIVWKITTWWWWFMLQVHCLQFFFSSFYDFPIIDKYKLRVFWFFFFINKKLREVNV